MFSGAEAGPWHGAVEGNVGHRWGVCSAQGGLLFKPENPSKPLQVQTWLGEPRRGQARCPGPQQQGSRWLGSWGLGSRGGPGTPFGPHDCSILV